MDPGDRVTATRVNNALQRLRKRYQKHRRVLAQVTIAGQKYRSASNVVDYILQIDPGPVVSISAQGFRISRGVLKKDRGGVGHGSRIVDRLQLFRPK